MTRRKTSALIGKWRIAAMDLWDKDGWAELDDDGTINGEISFHLGDESAFKARRW